MQFGLIIGTAALNDSCKDVNTLLYFNEYIITFEINALLRDCALETISIIDLID